MEWISTSTHRTGRLCNAPLLIIPLYLSLLPKCPTPLSPPSEKTPKRLTWIETTHYLPPYPNYRTPTAAPPPYPPPPPPPPIRGTGHFFFGFSFPPAPAPAASLAGHRPSSAYCRLVAAGHGRMCGAPTTRNAIAAVVVNSDAVLSDFGWSTGGISLLSFVFGVWYRVQYVSSSS